MFVSIPPKLSVSSFVRYLKGKSSLMIFGRYANLKYKYRNRNRKNIKNETIIVEITQTKVYFNSKSLKEKFLWKITSN